MPDPMTLASAVLSSFNHVNNLIKGFFSARDKVINFEQLNALQSEIASINKGYLSLLQQNTTLVTEIDSLKKEITRFETWEAQKKRYKLHSPWNGAIVYSLTESQSGGEPPHWICTKCYEKGERSILQSRHGKNRREEYFCQCGTIVHSQHGGTYKIRYAPDDAGDT